MVQEEHALRLVGRADLTVTGVTEVSRFEEDAVLLQTDLGELTIQGESLQLKELSLDGGRVAVSGNISALIYGGPRQSGGWLHRLLG